jgi:hypothetical protein
MRLIALVALLLVGLSAPAFSCDLTAGPGASFRLNEGKSGGVATIGCVFGEKWELRAYYFGEQVIYQGTLGIKPYAALSASRLWMFREGHRIRPMLQAGLMFKEAERCHFDGDVQCNRITPLPLCFLAVAGVKVGDVLLTFNHCSNASLDHGPEKKNLGQDFIRAEVWF